MQKILLIIFFIAFDTANADPFKDSLLQVFYGRKDTIAVRAGLELNKYLINKQNQPDSVLYYTSKLLELAIEIDDKYGEIKCYSWNGNTYFFKAQYELAIGWFDQALQMAQKHQYVVLQADLNNRLGACYNNINQQQEAIKYLIAAAKAFEVLDDMAGLAQAYYAISLAYKTQKQPDKRVFYITKAVALADQLPEREYSKKVSIYSSAAICYLETHPKQKAYTDKAITFAKKGEMLANTHNISSAQSLLASFYSGYYFNAKQYEQSISYALKGLANRKALSQTDLFNLYYRLAEAYREDKDIKAAYQYIDSAKALQSMKDPTLASNIAQSEYQLSKMTGASDKALEALETYKMMQDSLLNLDKSKALNELETKYQTELKDEQIAKMEQQKLIDDLRIRSLWGFALAALLAVIIVVVVFKQIMVRNKLKIVEAEQRLNRARMNPHFFFNALSTLQGLVLKENEVGKTVQRISQFASIMRFTLESTFQETITIEEEREFLSKYLELAKMRNEDWFEYTISVDDNIGLAKIPVMLVQPFVENAIEHGFGKINYKGVLDIHFAKQNDTLHITICDNGVGMDKAKNKSQHLSRATQITNDRLLLLKAKDTGYTIQSNQPQGTKINITLPYTET